MGRSNAYLINFELYERAYTQLGYTYYLLNEVVN
jgi:hypothetical protein